MTLTKMRGCIIVGTAFDGSFTWYTRFELALSARQRARAWTVPSAELRWKTLTGGNKADSCTILVGSYVRENVSLPARALNIASRCPTTLKTGLSIDTMLTRARAPRTFFPTSLLRIQRI